MSNPALDYARDADVAAFRKISDRVRTACGRGWFWIKAQPATFCSLTGATLLGLLSTGLMIDHVRLSREREISLRRTAELETRLERDRDDLEHARRAIGDSLARVGGSPRLDEPSLRPLRGRLLLAALDFHQGTIRRRDGEAVPGFDHALARLDAAAILMSLGRQGDAYQDFRAAEWMLFDLIGRRPGDREVRAAMAVCRQGLGELRAERGDPEGAAYLFDQAIETLSRDRRGSENDPARLDLLASCALGKGKVALDTALWNEARSSLEQARSLWTRLKEVERREPIWVERLAETLDALGRLDEETGRLDAAESDYRAAIAARETIIGEGSTGLSSIRQARARDRLRLGLLRRAAGDADEAEVLFRAAAAERDFLERTVPWLDLEGGAQNSGALGPLPAAFGDLDREMRSAVRGLAVWTRPCGIDPDDEQARRALADAHAALALRLARRNDLAEAATHFRAALESSSKLLNAQPTVSAFQHRHALDLYRHARALGPSFAAKDQFDHASAEWNWSEKNHPYHLTFLWRQGDGHLRLGAARTAWGWSDRAVESYRVAVDRFRRTSSARPDSFKDRWGLALALSGLADATAEGEEAVVAARQAVVAWKDLLARLPAHPDGLDGLARLLANAPVLGDRDPKSALILARRALAIVPDRPRYRVTLALALLRLDRPEAALEALGDLRETDADAAIVASLAFSRLKRAEAARASLESGIESAESWIADDQTLAGPSRALLLEAAALASADDPDLDR